MTVERFIKERPYLVWHANNYSNLSTESVVEATLNYGDWEDVQTLIKIVGIGKIAKIFRKQIERKRCNYREKGKNFFSLYFKAHSHAR